MKKILMICLVITMVFSMSAYAFAAGGFMESPSNNQAPTLVSVKNEDENSVAQLLVTALADKADLPKEARETLEEAYQQIVENTDLSVLTEEIEEVAKALDADVADLAVSDLFDISVTEENHGRFYIALELEMLNNFVCLLHYHDGKWNVVKDAKISADGKYLEFSQDEFSPFAVVVNVPEEKPDSPATQDVSAIYAAVAAISALGLIVLGVYTKKQKA